MKTKVDPDECIACGVCTDSCPSVYTMEDDYAVAIEGEVSGEDEECVRQAMSDCPVEAISIDE
ncbi:MAG: ferredoxin [Deltaproteobacteria bacterium]|nr:ferredoxin [Deltaproteobacteria bacterium]